jgi:hypothetical protein
MFLVGLQEKFYVNAHVGEEPDAFSKLTIRGQLVQKFTADLMGSNNVAPFKAPKSAAGEATISVEAAGTVVCFDASFFKASKTCIGSSVVLAGGSDSYGYQG